MPLIGESPKFLELMERISLFAKSNRPVFLLGERGTGKELVAQRLHLLSGRGLKRLVSLNCSAFSSDLLNSELFGHEKGAFTGATEHRDGKIALAHGGTCFLDEIANSTMAFQEQILRVVEYGEIQRVGGNLPLQVDVRMIAATNENPAKLAESHRFRMDLLDRLSFGVIHLPTLSERKEDIPLLVYHFGNLMLRDMGYSSIVEFSEGAMEQMMDYAWPGNVRELKNVVERAVFVYQGRPVELVELNPWKLVEVREDTKPKLMNEVLTQHSPPQNLGDRPATCLSILPLDFGAELSKFKLNMLKMALAESRNNQVEAAKLLTLTYAQFRGYLKQYRQHLTAQTL